MDPSPIREHPPYAANLRVGYLLGKAWPIFKANLGVIVGAMFVYMVIAFILSGGEALGLGFGLTALGNLLIVVVSGPLTVGLYGIMLRLVRGEEATIGNLFDGFQEFGRAFGVYILMTIAVIVGLILLIIPGIIVAIGLWPAMYLVYDERDGVTDTLTRAWDLTRGHKFELFILGVVLIVITLCGLIALGVGIIFTAAFVQVVGAAAYEELSLEAS